MEVRCLDGPRCHVAVGERWVERARMAGGDEQAMRVRLSIFVVPSRQLEAGHDLVVSYCLLFRGE